ncbi:ELMOD3 [Symbiodinium sp. CCMP2592]|nr:ELMOD3 [Symbiodinium sp. CCMP2592]
MAEQANSLLTVLPPGPKVEAGADDLVFDIGLQDASDPASASTAATAADSSRHSRQAPPAIEVGDVGDIGVLEGSESGESVASADLLQLIQQASEVEISSDSADSRKEAPTQPAPEPESADSPAMPSGKAVAEVEVAGAAQREGVGHDARPREESAPRSSGHAEEDDGIELSMEHLPSQASGRAAEVTFAVGGFAATASPAEPAEPMNRHQEDTARSNAVDEMFADILGPIDEAPAPAATRAAAPTATATSSRRIVVAEPAGPLSRGKDSSDKPDAAGAMPSTARSLTVPAASTGASKLSSSKASNQAALAHLMQESAENVERREPVPQNTSPANSSVRNEADEDATLDKEWDEIARRTDELIANARESKGVVAVSQDVLSQPLSYKDFTQWLLQLEIDPAALRQMREEMVEDDMAGCVGCFMKPRQRPRSEVPGLDRRFCADKDLVLFLKVTHFDFNDSVHHRMLRTMYGKLSRNKVCPTVGRHWELLGFQSGDPRTDLNRSGGVLNVMQMFYFFAHHFDLMKAAYLLAQDAQHNFPLACVSINITKMVIECLLEGRLSKLCNNSRGVFETVCVVYSGAFFHWYWRWRTQKRSIRDTELTFKEVRALLERRPAKLIDMLQEGMLENKAKTDPSRLEFTDIDFGGTTGKGKESQGIPDGLQRYQYDE